MKKQTKIGLITLAILIIAGCTITLGTTINNFNPNLSCIPQKNCYYAFGHHNLAPNTQIQINIKGWNNNYINYESTNGNQYNNIANAYMDSLQATGENKIIMHIPICDQTIGKTGYLQTGHTRYNETLKIGDIQIGNPNSQTNTVTTIHQKTAQNTYLLLPITLQTNINILYDTETSTNVNTKLWCK